MVAVDQQDLRCRYCTLWSLCAVQFDPASLSLLFGKSLQRQQLLAHHEQVAPRK